MAESTEKGQRRKRWSYTLRLLGRNPTEMSLERLGEYAAEFARLLGQENRPVFAGIRKASTGIRARVPQNKEHLVHARITQAKQQPQSQPGRHLAKLQHMIDVDGVGDAELLNRDDNVIYLFPKRSMNTAAAPTLQQTGTVDGIVTGLVGADDTMHLHLRDWADRDLKIIVRDEVLARSMLQHFRGATLRVTVSGTWKRTDHGWVPENNKATAIGYEELDDVPLSQVLQAFASIPGNGWRSMKDPYAFLAELQGDDE